MCVVTWRGDTGDMWSDDRVTGTSAALPAAVRNPSARAAVPVSVPASTAPPADAWQWWWQYARHSARCWLNGIAPPVIDIHGPVLDDDEHGLLEADMAYSRLYGGDARYRRSDVIVLGRPAVMAGVLAVSAVTNHRRKVAARREAEVCWRDAQLTHVWVTTHRLIVAGTFGLASFYYESVTEFHPDLDNWSLTLGFDESCPPLRLSGPASPAICLWAGTAILGDRWLRDPRLGRLVA